MITEAEQLAILERIPGFVRPSEAWLKGLAVGDRVMIYRCREGAIENFGLSIVDYVGADHAGGVAVQAKFNGANCIFGGGRFFDYSLSHDCFFWISPIEPQVEQQGAIA